MRIAYVCVDPGVPVFGTKRCSVHVREAIRALSRRGGQVSLFTVRPGGTPPTGFKAVPVHLLSPIPSGDPATRERAALDANAELHRALEREGPFDLVYERYSLWSFAGMAYARDAGIPGLLEVNAPLVEEQIRHRGLVDQASAQQVARRVFGDAAALIAVSQGVATYLSDYPETSGRVHVIPNGVRPEQFSPRVPPAFSSEPGTFTVGFVGTLKPWHGLPVLIEAFRQLHTNAPAARLLIVGDGPERASLTAMVDDYGLSEAVRFTGAVTHDAVPALLSAMDVAVAPYPNLPDFYFSPLKVLEYMAAGVPVVASRIGQLRDLIRQNVSGILCPPGDAATLAAALFSLWRHPFTRFQLAQAAHANVLRHHTWDAVANRLIQVAAGAHNALPQPEEVL